MHSIQSNKNIVSWKMTWYFVDEEGVPRGIPKLWRLYFLDISWSDMGIPNLELLYTSSHLIILLSLHLKTSFIQNFTQFLLATLVHAR
jgi:hypothetical protein